MSTDLDTRLRLALQRIAAAAPNGTSASRQWALDLADGTIAIGPQRSRRQPILTLVAAAVVVLGATGAIVLANRSPDPPTRPTAADLVIRRVPPEQRAGFVFDRAYRIAGFPVVNFGRLDPPDPSQAFCTWTGEGGGCGATEFPWFFEISNETSNAWVWTQVPSNAEVAIFTNRHGATLRQVPVDGIAIFPDGTRGAEDGCECSIQALDSAGNVVASHSLMETVPYDSEG